MVKNSGEKHEQNQPLRIHGKHDHVIPTPAQVDLALDGGHLIAMTQADECARFLKSVVVT